MASARPSWLLLALMSLAACKRGPDPGSSPSAAAAATTAGAANAAAPSDPDLRMPEIRLRAGQVELDGRFAGTTRVIEDLGRLQKIDELFDRLKEKRESFKAKHPSQAFPGRALLGAAPEMPALVFKSAFQTIAYSGYPHVMIETPGGFVLSEAIIPGPAAAPDPGITLHVQIGTAGIALVEKQGATVVSEVQLDAPDPATLAVKLKAAVVDAILRREVRASTLPIVVVHADNRVPFSGLGAMLRALRSAHERLAGPGLDQGAFVIELSVN